jgi:hypothetical protein
MSISSPPLRRFARHALVATTGVTAPDLSQLAAAFDVLCDRLRARLHPMFGTEAIAALFARAHRMATSEFPWLTSVVPKDGERCSLDGVEALSRRLEPNTMADGLAAVLAHDIGLLSTFIGDDLVMPLVQEAWGTASVSDRPTKTEGNQ